MSVKIHLSSGITFEDSGRLEVLKTIDIISIAYLCSEASQIGTRNLGCARSTDSLFVQRRDKFYFRPAVASRDLDAVPHYISQS